jgi:hypothetical protein
MSVNESIKNRLAVLRGRRNRELVTVPEIVELLGDEPLYVAGLSGKERDDYEGSFIEMTGKGRRREPNLNKTNQRAKLLVRCLVDAAGKRIFDDGDIILVGEWPAAVLDPIYDQAMRLSGIGLEAQEELEKNSTKAGGDASSSGSPDTSAGVPSNGVLAASAAQS